MSLVEDAAQVAELQAMQKCSQDRSHCRWCKVECRWAAHRYKGQGQCMCDARCTFALRVGVAPASIAAKHKRRGVTR